MVSFALEYFSFGYTMLPLWLSTWCAIDFHDGIFCLRNSVAEFLSQKSGTAVEGQLHCVDNLAHEHTTAHLIQQGAQQLGLLDHLQLHVDDAWTFHDVLDSSMQLDFVWVDFGAGERLDEFFSHWWTRVPPGGMVAVHVRFPCGSYPRVSLLSV